MRIVWSFFLVAGMAAPIFGFPPAAARTLFGGCEVRGRSRRGWKARRRSGFGTITGQECAGFNCTVRVEKTGVLRMPVTVAARLADGSEQARTEPLADADELKFQGKAALQEVVIEPERAVALAEAPPTVRSVMAK